MQNNWTPDESQQRVLAAGSGFHLVLAPPGCGKTQMLAERVAKARNEGIDYKDMLCLTFTNRAARGMYERLQSRLGNDEGMASLFVGNVHRFCSKFLYEQGLLAAECAVIDENDAVSILARYLGEDEQMVATNGNRKRDYTTIINLSHFMHQMAMKHPRHIRMHADCLNSEDITALRNMLSIMGKEFSADQMVDVYNNALTYEDAMVVSNLNLADGHIISNMLKKMKFAHAYEAYKEQNNLVDFEDLLLKAYDALSKSDEYHKYSWMQVDEVQDLNFLQLSILDLLLAPEATVVYLGDEQQAIFSFMGAKMEIMKELKERCCSNIYHLDVNHRSPSYLLDVYNKYAMQVMDIDGALLPKAANITKAEGNELTLMECATVDEEYKAVALKVRDFYNEHPDETTAVIVNSNRDADSIGYALDDIAMPHFKVSGTDIFTTDGVKLLFAHYSVIANEFNFIAWARLLKGMGIMQTNASARALVRQLRVRGMVPTDLLEADGKTYVQQFAKALAEKELVVFDTETTGLDVYNDDILQIAACKMREGRVVEGSELSLYIATDKPIPEMLGDIVNPIVEERKQHELLSPAEALQRFLDYVGDDILLGHNATYDYDIMDFNLKRYLPSVDWRKEHPVCFDSLKLARLLFPGFVKYKLKNLIEYLHLEGENSHLADADVFATCSLVARCYDKAQEMIPEHVRYLQQGDVPHKAELLRQRYAELWYSTLAMAHQRSNDDETPTLVADMQRVWEYLMQERRVVDSKKLQYVLNYIQLDLLPANENLTLKQALDRYVVEMNTLREADICGGTSMKERVFVSTIHKAKGLEFDNVIVFDVIDGRYPNYYNHGIKHYDDEDARKLYVAMTRARKRLCISVSTMKKRFDGTFVNIPHSKFLLPIELSLKKE